MILLLLAGCLPHAAVTPDIEAMHAFAMEARGRTVAGMAAVSVGDGPWHLEALLPSGTSLFSVTVDDGVTIDAPDEDLARWLGRVPFDRDLAALYRYRCEVERCRAGRWKLVRDGEGWKVRGPGGPARLATDGPLRVLTDARRGYTLKVHVP